ncbi:nuclear transport factor 2 family protein [Chitinasiproducens palmae]|uniref:SnoaL-like domain-containing protein n=1 Tax=Chitinasiproducens palmae TaxID=1770053 RepID=A0A1H2PLK2_9BURK|nr:nuclear transport factor 2 family protein [Chitinasiproducens palmae]SDV47287.1 SnoaL-like domain-containing protein [Chitinasiproducens palmae]
MTLSSLPPSAATPNGDIASRLARLEAIEEIRALKAHYGALADAKYQSSGLPCEPAELDRIAGLQAACFTDDAVWAGGDGFGGDLTGRPALHDWFRRMPWRFAMHCYTSESIRVDVDTNRAEAVWRLTQVAIRNDNGRAVWLGGVTREHYRREPTGDWRIARMRFEQLHMLALAEDEARLATNFQALDALSGNRSDARR